MFLSFIIFAVFTVAMFTAAYRDALTMTIPNWASLLVLAGFFVCIPFVWLGWTNFGEHIAVGLSVFLFGFIVFAFGWLGGGDAKLMAATAFWWTWPDLFMYVMYTTLAGGVIAAFILAGRMFVPARILTIGWVHRLIKDEKQMPYGLALAFGALATLPQSQIFLSAAGLG